jgi:hypothetical protein
MQRFNSLEEGETDENWREDVLEQITPFLYLLEDQ